MKNSKALFEGIRSKLSLRDDGNEINTIAFAVVQKVFGLSRAQVLAEVAVDISREEENRLLEIIERLNHHEPLQYVLSEAFFYGRKFLVEPGVLIPRPETELLIEVVSSSAAVDQELNMIDVGTGSGCIPVTLKLEYPNSRLFATDISNEALIIAGKNAKLYGVSVNFMFHNIITQHLPFGMFDVIVSNPPYVRESEKASMDLNVLNHEPELALFVPDQDPLIYYKSIAKKSFDALKPGGLVAVEINEKFGKEVAELFSVNRFSNIEIIQDLFQKDRVVKAIKPRKSNPTAV
jgi:release factor glutamine methyltransferase